MVNVAAALLAVLLALVALPLLARARRLARLVRTLNALTPSRAADLQPGIRLVRGRLGGDPLLSSPYQGRPCVYYFFRVLEPRKERKPRNLATGKEWTFAHVEDASGRVDIEAWPALVASPRRFEATLRNLATIPPHLATFFERAGIDEKHLGRLPTLLVHEYTLEPGDEVYVTGTVRPGETGPVLFRHGRDPLIVSADADIGYTRGIRHEWGLNVALGGLLLLGATAFAWLAVA